jgi:AraC-like DNA-binding protein
VLLVRHAVRGPTEEVSWRQDELRGSDLVIVRARYRGAYRDEQNSPELAEGCASIRFVVSGRLVARAPGADVDLHAGQLHVSATHGTARARMLVPDSDCLLIGWRTRSGVCERPTTDGRLDLSPTTRAALVRLADALDAPHASSLTTSVAAADALAALRSEGLPIRPCAVHENEGGAPPLDAEHDVARAVERSASSLSSHPTSADLAQQLRVGEHHALRRANAYFRRLYFSVGGWREYLRKRRVDLGAFFMGHPQARTEDVARALGFRSATSFCHAFQSAGLPSPRTVQRELLAG